MVVLVVMDGVEVDLVVVKAAMVVLFVMLGCSVLDEIEFGVQFWEQVYVGNTI